MSLAKDTQVYADIFKMTCNLFELTKRFSRDLKPSLGKRIEEVSLDMADEIVRTNIYTDKAMRVECLIRAAVLYERLQLLVNISVSQHQISPSQQSRVAREMAGIGRQITAWRNSENPKNRKLQTGSNTSTDG